MSPPVFDIHFTWPDGSRRLTLIRSCTSKKQGDRNRRVCGLFQARWFRLHTHCTRRGRSRAVPRHSPLVRVLVWAGPLIIIHMKAEPWRQPPPAAAAARRATEATPRRTDITRTHYKASRLVARTRVRARSFGRPVASLPHRSLPPRREERRRHNLRSLERAVNPMHAGTPRRTRERARDREIVTDRLKREALLTGGIRHM